MSEGNWVKVCRVDDIRRDEGKQVEVEGITIGLYRLDDGCFALNDVCTHAFAHLSTGFVEDDTVECPLHQARFEIRTGKALDDIAPDDVATYAVKVEDGDVYVQMGVSDTEAAPQAASGAVGSALALLQADASATEWTAILAPDAEFEVLNGHLTGADAVAERLGDLRSGHLEWSQLDRPGNICTGQPRAGTGDRGIAVMFGVSGDGESIQRVSQQNLPMPPRAGTPMVMDVALRERFDTSLADKSPMSLAYVDAEGRPHLSLRGSVRSFGEDRLALWARNADAGLAAAVRANPNVALLYRNEAVRGTYQLAGRAYVAEDEATRRAVYDAMPKVERDHDFAMLGAAIVIDLDLVEGWASLGPNGLVDPVKLVRE